MGEWSDHDVGELKRLWKSNGGKIRKVAKAMGRSQGSIDGKSRVLGLQFPHGKSTILAPESPAIIEARTIFRGQVHEPGTNVLKWADNNRKLGGKIIKSRWRGMRMYSLSLEERATCPRTCRQFQSCYGNQMQWAIRFAHGLDLEIQIWRELAVLQKRYPRGFVVRLHLLGDFPSVSYVDLWQAALQFFPALNVFGYTHWQAHTPIGAAISVIRHHHWDRFAVRTSDAQRGPRTSVIKDAVQAKGRIICPAQTGRTANCASCGLCWQTKKPIAFLAH